MQRLSFNNSNHLIAINNCYVSFTHLCPGLPWCPTWSWIHLQCRKPRFNPWVGKIPWRRKWQPTPVFLFGKSHGQRSLVGYSPWGRKELDMTEQLNQLPWVHLSLVSSHKCLLWPAKIAFSCTFFDWQGKKEKVTYFRKRAVYSWSALSLNLWS